MQHQCFVETIAVSRQSAGNADVFRQMRQQPPRQIAAVNVDPIRKNKDMYQIFFSQRLCKRSAGEKTAAAYCFETDPGSICQRVFKLYRGSDQRIVRNLGVQNFTGRGTPQKVGIRIYFPDIKQRFLSC